MVQIITDSSTLINVAEGKEMGIDVILTSSGHQAYDVLEKGSVLIIESIKDLMTYIKK